MRIGYLHTTGKVTLVMTDEFGNVTDAKELEIKIVGDLTQAKWEAEYKKIEEQVEALRKQLKQAKRKPKAKLPPAIKERMSNGRHN